MDCEKFPTIRLLIKFAPNTCTKKNRKEVHPGVKETQVKNYHGQVIHTAKHSIYQGLKILGLCSLKYKYISVVTSDIYKTIFINSNPFWTIQVVITKCSDKLARCTKYRYSVISIFCEV